MIVLSIIREHTYSIIFYHITKLLSNIFYKKNIYILREMQ